MQTHREHTQIHCRDRRLSSGSLELGGSNSSPKQVFLFKLDLLILRRNSSIFLFNTFFSLLNTRTGPLIVCVTLLRACLGRFFSSSFSKKSALWADNDERWEIIARRLLRNATVSLVLKFLQFIKEFQSFLAKTYDCSRDTLVHFFMLQSLLLTHTLNAGK